jgi:hypothetical protein
MRIGGYSTLGSRLWDDGRARVQEGIDRVAVCPMVQSASC